MLYQLSIVSKNVHFIKYLGKKLLILVALWVLVGPQSFAQNDYPAHALSHVPQEFATNPELRCFNLLNTNPKLNPSEFLAAQIAFNDHLRNQKIKISLQGVGSQLSQSERAYIKENMPSLELSQSQLLILARVVEFNDQIYRDLGMEPDQLDLVRVSERLAYLFNMKFSDFITNKNVFAISKTIEAEIFKKMINIAIQNLGYKALTKEELNKSFRTISLQEFLYNVAQNRKWSRMLTNQMSYGALAQWIAFKFTQGLEPRFIYPLIVNESIKSK